MRTVLLNLPWGKDGRLGVRAGSRWPFTSEPGKEGRLQYIPFPFFLSYAAALLKKSHKEIILIDAIAENIDSKVCIERVAFFDAGLIVAETSTPSFYSDISIIREIKERLPACRIALCGPHASIFPVEILKEYDCIDCVLVGEYEFTLLDLVKHLEEGVLLEKVLGLAYRKDSQIVVNNPRPTIDNLDILPWPERETLPMYKYNDGFAGLPLPNCQLWASRGCPFQCNFCLWPQAMYREHKHRKRDYIDVVNEMEFLINKFKFKAVYFDDDVFNIDRDYVLKISKEIKERQIKTPWAVMARADLMDAEELFAMAGAGLYAIKYGIESADEKILRFCNKKLDLEKAVSIIKFTKSLGVKVHLTFCLGFPGETEETLRKTRLFIEKTAPDSLQFSLATPFPGTEYFKYCDERNLLLSRNWDDYDGNYSKGAKTVQSG